MICLACKKEIKGSPFFVRDDSNTELRFAPVCSTKRCIAAGRTLITPRNYDLERAIQNTDFGEYDIEATAPRFHNLAKQAAFSHAAILEQKEFLA
jgi:hypothetical protein